MVGSLPIAEQIVQLRIEVLGGRVPRLHEKIVDAGLIDSADRGGRVGVCGEQGALGVGINLHGFLEEMHAVQARHALVGEEQGHAVVAEFQLLQKVERALGRTASEDAIIRAVLRTQVAFDALGMVVGAAVMGKPAPAPVEGDSLTGFDPDPTQSQLDSVFDAADP